jgi:hypothetical protein
MTGLSARNVVRVLQALENKLALEVAEIEDGRTRTPKRFRVFSMQSIKKRWSAAGFHYFYRNKNLVDLVKLPDDSLSSGDKLTSHDKLPPTPGDKLTLSPGAKLSPLLRSNYKNSSEETTSSSPAVRLTEVVAAIRRVVGRCDDQAANTIVRKCRTFAPNAPDEHIVIAIDTIATEIRAKKGSVESPMGYLIRYVPPFFEGESYRQFVNEETEQKRLAREEELKTARQILADGDTHA